MPDLLVDLSCLNTLSRYRGIGRYALELGRALALQAPTDLKLGALGQLQASGSAALAEGLDYPGAQGRTFTRSDDRDVQRSRERNLANLARRLGARAVHLLDPSRLAAKRALRSVVTCHDLIPIVLANEYYSDRPWRRWRERRRLVGAFGQADRLIAVSHATKNDLVRLCGIDSERVDVVYHGIDHQLFCVGDAAAAWAEVRSQLMLERPFLVYVGGADVRRRVPLLIRAYRASQIAREFSLVLIGSEHSSNAEVLRAASDAGAGDVRLLGYVPDALLGPVYRAAHAHVFPSVYEGFGFPVLESMACGTPTLVCLGSALTEIAGGAALAFDADDLDSLRGGIERVCLDSEVRSRLQAEGPKVAQGYTWSRCAEETREVYRRVLSEQH